MIYRDILSFFVPKNPLKENLSMFNMYFICLIFLISSKILIKSIEFFF